MRESEGILSVMMPAYNEEATLALAIERVLARPEVGELIVVDDASTDGTWRILSELASREPRIRPFRQSLNQGKGAAVRRAIKELDRPYAIVQDADLEVDPAEYPSLLEPLLEGRADAVFGSRAFRVTSLSSLVYTLGNRALTLATNIIFWGWVEDMETCYKLLPSPLWQSLPLRAQRFEFEPEVTSQLMRRRSRIANVKIHYRPRTGAEGKKLGLADGWQALVCLLRLRFAPASSAPAPGRPDSPGE
jgi:glycosyltransferase involved in cell wall biosynthesis